MNLAAAPHCQRTVVYFVPDSSDAKLFARAAALTAAGVRLITVGFRRKRYDTGQVITWEHVDLGLVSDRKYFQRIVGIAVGLRRTREIAKFIHKSREPTVVLARNLDMALLAMLCSVLFRLHGVLVYEVLDIRKIMITNGLVGRVLRWLERLILARAQCLWISAPAFFSAYFKPLQFYQGRWQLLENKLVDSWPVQANSAPIDRWVIGWFGTLRCERSLRILCRLAESLGTGVEIMLRGFPSRIGVERFKAAIASHPNISFGGSYSPAELPTMMASIHFSWAFDYSDDWGNSLWLLPNRLYEAAYFERPLLADASHETGRKVEADGLGWAISGDPFTGLVELLGKLDHDGWERKCSYIRSLDKDRFASRSDLVPLIREVCG